MSISGSKKLKKRHSLRHQLLMSCYGAIAKSNCDFYEANKMPMIKNNI